MRGRSSSRRLGRVDGVPERVQLRRRKGWTLPPNTVVVSRPGKWGNPFVVGTHGTRQECVNRFAYLVVGGYVCETRATAWADSAARSAGPDRQAALARVDGERRIAAHHRHVVEMCEAIGEHLRAEARRVIQEAGRTPERAGRM